LFTFGIIPFIFKKLIDKFISHQIQEKKRGDREDEKIIKESWGGREI
jgi:hypothetical protein